MRNRLIWMPITIALWMLATSVASAADVTITIADEPQILEFKEHGKFGGIRRSLCRVNPSLILWLDEQGTSGQADYQALLIAENTLQDAAAQLSIDFTAVVGGKKIQCKVLKRLRSAHWLIAGKPVFKNPGLLMPNSVVWTDEWRADYPLHTDPLIAKNQNTRATGGAPRLGTRVAWGNDPDAVMAQQQVTASFPIMLRDPETLQLVRDTTIGLGFNPNVERVKALPVLPDGKLDGKAYGMKLDPEHAWSTLEPYLASKGTVLNRRSRDIIEAHAVYLCLCDSPGKLWNKNPRAVGRSMRAVVDWCEIARQDGEPDQWAEEIAKTCFDKFEACADDIFSAPRALRKSKLLKVRCVAPFEWLHLLYGMQRYCDVFQVDSKFIPAVLNWLAQFDGMPYEIVMEGPDRVRFDNATVVATEKSTFVANPGRYNTYRPETYGFDHLRHMRGMPTKRPLDDPFYVEALDHPRSAGFWLAWPKKSSDTVASDRVDPDKP